MSRVIKYAALQEEPRYVGSPPKDVNKASGADDGDEPDIGMDFDEPAKPSFDEEAQARMLEEIAAKEERAGRMLQEARISSDIMKQEAQQEHDRIIAEAQEEVEKMKAEAKQAAHEEGLAEGREEGLAKAREEMQQQLLDSTAKAEHTLKTAKEAMQDYVVQAENEIITIAMQVVEKILPQHCIDVPQDVLPLVRQTIMKVRDQKEIIIHIAPACYDIVLAARDELRALLEGGGTNLEINPDDSLQPGDCLLETPNGNVDARLSTQLELIRKAVQEVML